MGSYKMEIYERINYDSPGRVYIANDFFDIADYETVRKNLNRFVDAGELNRIINGIYYRPQYIEIIGEYEAPSVDEVAKAIARKYNWTIAPSGNTALNLLGLSTQVPAKWTYISDGRYANYELNDNRIIEFKRRSNSEISNMSTMSATIIQAIKALGKDQITDNQIDYLRDKLTLKQKQDLLQDGSTSAAWVYKVIKEICEE